MAARKKPAAKKKGAPRKRAAKRAGPGWAKSPPALVDAFAAALPDDPRVERRSMFGYPAAFANGQLFTGLHQSDLMVRLGDTDRAARSRSSRCRDARCASTRSCPPRCKPIGARCAAG